MLFYLLSSFVQLVFPRDVFTCDESNCPSYWIGDGWCDEVCMNPSCNYDSLNQYSTSTFDIFVNSDCFSNCLSTNCDPDSLGNNVCDTDCNIYECGWDLGDCGYCESGCTEALLTNDVCDSLCNNADCMYDNDGCGWCAVGCFLEDLEDSVCQSACNNTACSWDWYECPIYFCASGCYPNWINDGYCDDVCDNAACGYDGNDCSCSDGCNIDVWNNGICETYSNGTIYDPCATIACSFKGGMCGDCAAGCFDSEIGNGHCDLNCNNPDCQYEGGDCQCNPGCDSIYNSATHSFDFTGTDPCDLDCLVASCYYNTQFCTDDFLVRASIINQIILQNPWAILNLDNCNIDCNEGDLHVFDSGTSCDSG